MSDVGSELYMMEQFLDYRMVEDHSEVEQAREIHTLACVLPNKFVANGVPNGWAMYAMAYLNILIHLVNNSVIDQIS